eukprot:3063443-Pyramimonas_sp.AAC.1
MATSNNCRDAGDSIDVGDDDGNGDGTANDGADADHAGDDDGVLASVMKVLEKGSTCARGLRARLARK